MKKLGAFAVIVGLLLFTGESQAWERPDTGWLAGGVGWGMIGSQGGGGGRLEAAVGFGNRVLPLRYSILEDSNGACDGIVCLGNDVSLPHNSARELAVQYGIKVRRPFLLGLASLGVGGLRTVTRGDTLLSQACFFGCENTYNSTTRWTGGATAELGGYLTSRVISFGPTLIVDVNPVQSFWGILIDLHVGWVGPAQPWSPMQPGPPSGYTNR